MVKLAVTFVFTAALAIATVRAQEAGAEAVEEVLARDVSSSESDLFGRAAAKVMNDLFSREELSEVYGRDIDGDLTWRDVTELVERESIDMSELEELAARAAAPQQSPDAPASGDVPATPKSPKNPEHKHHDGKSVFGQVLSFFNRLMHPKPAHKNGDHSKSAAHKDAHAKGAAHKGEHAHAKGEKAAHKAEKAPAKEEPAPHKEAAAEGAAEGGAEEAREFLEEPVERSLEDEIDLAARDFLSDDEALEVRELLDTAELELEAREVLDAAELDLMGRGFEDEDLMEARELLEEYSDILERDFDEDVFERDVEDDLFERDFEEDLLEREIGEEWDDELLRRAFDIVEELEMLD